MLLTLYGVLCGPLIDAVGVRGCLIVSALATGTARTIMALTRSKGLALFSYFLPAAVGGALGVPVLTIGVKRCSPQHARGFAFSIFYCTFSNRFYRFYLFLKRVLFLFSLVPLFACSRRFFSSKKR